MIEREARHRDGPVQQNLLLVGCLGPVIRDKQARNVGDAANEGIVEHQGLVIEKEGAVERIRVQREGERPTEEAGEERCENVIQAGVYEPRGVRVEASAASAG